MKVKEAKNIPMRWSVNFRQPEGNKKDGILSKEEFCELLKLNGISYEENRSMVFNYPQIYFIATFQQMAHMSESLHISLSDVSASVWTGIL